MNTKSVSTEMLDAGEPNKTEEIIKLLNTSEELLTSAYSAFVIDAHVAHLCRVFNVYKDTYVGVRIQDLPVLTRILHVLVARLYWAAIVLQSGLASEAFKAELACEAFKVEFASETCYETDERRTVVEPSKSGDNVVISTSLPRVIQLKSLRYKPRSLKLDELVSQIFRGYCNTITALLRLLLEPLRVSRSSEPFIDLSNSFPELASLLAVTMIFPHFINQKFNTAGPQAACPSHIGVSCGSRKHLQENETRICSHCGQLQFTPFDFPLHLSDAYSINATFLHDVKILPDPVLALLKNTTYDKTHCQCVMTSIKEAVLPNPRSIFAQAENQLYALQYNVGNWLETSLLRPHLYTYSTVISKPRNILRHATEELFFESAAALYAAYALIEATRNWYGCNSDMDPLTHICRSNCFSHACQRLFCRKLLKALCRLSKSHETCKIIVRAPDFFGTISALLKTAAAYSCSSKLVLNSQIVELLHDVIELIWNCVDYECELLCQVVCASGSSFTNDIKEAFVALAYGGWESFHQYKKALSPTCVGFSPCSASEATMQHMCNPNVMEIRNDLLTVLLPLFRDNFAAEFMSSHGVVDLLLNAHLPTYFHYCKINCKSIAAGSSLQAPSAILPDSYVRYESLIWYSVSNCLEHDASENTTVLVSKSSYVHRLLLTLCSSYECSHEGPSCSLSLPSVFPKCFSLLECKPCGTQRLAKLGRSQLLALQNTAAVCLLSVAAFTTHSLALSKRVTTESPIAVGGLKTGVAVIYSITFRHLECPGALRQKYLQTIYLGCVESHDFASALLQNNPVPVLLETLSRSASSPSMVSENERIWLLGILSSICGHRTLEKDSDEAALNLCIECQGKSTTGDIASNDVFSMQCVRCAGKQQFASCGGLQLLADYIRMPVLGGDSSDVSHITLLYVLECICNVVLPNTNLFRLWTGLKTHDEKVPTPNVRSSSSRQTCLSVYDGVSRLLDLLAYFHQKQREVYEIDYSSGTHECKAISIDKKTSKRSYPETREHSKTWMFSPSISIQNDAVLSSVVVKTALGCLAQMGLHRDLYLPGHIMLKWKTSKNFVENAAKEPYDGTRRPMGAVELLLQVWTYEIQRRAALLDKCKGREGIVTIHDNKHDTCNPLFATASNLLHTAEYSQSPKDSAFPKDSADCSNSIDSELTMRSKSSTISNCPLKLCDNWDNNSSINGHSSGLGSKNDSDSLIPAYVYAWPHEKDDNAASQPQRTHPKHAVESNREVVLSLFGSSNRIDVCSRIHCILKELVKVASWRHNICKAKLTKNSRSRRASCPATCRIRDTHQLPCHKTLLPNRKLSGEAPGPTIVHPLLCIGHSMNENFSTITSFQGDNENEECISILGKWKHSCPLIRILSYPIFQEYRVWLSVAESVKRKQVLPVASDRAWVAEELRRRRDHVLKLKKLEQSIRCWKASHEMTSLKRFFSEIMEKQQILRTSPEISA